jgi:hypothetical protein
LISVLAPFATRVREVQPHTATKRIIATRIQDYLPLLLRVAYTGLDPLQNTGSNDSDRHSVEGQSGRDVVDALSGATS